ncbi:MAG: rRNA maturation RNase YbeY [Gammaproteobacteria bacterium]
MTTDEHPVIALEIQRAATASWLPADAEFSRWVAATLAAHRFATQAGTDPEARGAGAMTIRLVDLREGIALNSQWRHKTGPTNVLAFPGPGVHEGPATAVGSNLPDGAPIEYGDLAICVPVIEREAADQGKQPVCHLAHLVIHGTLHLLGYTHEAENDTERMESLETRILAGFDIRDPYVRNVLLS